MRSCALHAARGVGGRPPNREARRSAARGSHLLGLGDTLGALFSARVHDLALRALVALRCGGRDVHRLLNAVRPRDALRAHLPDGTLGTAPRLAACGACATTARSHEPRIRCGVKGEFLPGVDLARRPHHQRLARAVELPRDVVRSRAAEVHEGGQVEERVAVHGRTGRPVHDPEALLRHHRGDYVQPPRQAPLPIGGLEVAVTQSPRGAHDVPRNNHRLTGGYNSNCCDVGAHLRDPSKLRGLEMLKPNRRQNGQFLLRQAARRQAKLPSTTRALRLDVLSRRGQPRWIAVREEQCDGRLPDDDVPRHEPALRKRQVSPDTAERYPHVAALARLLRQPLLR
mmetsp:Transcript_105376/g.295268  ORF Transcript_105376/g.295268 Transcript_105376/m.295268 type:complete len:342 (-) Transcript_105376:114-1139(-)